MIIYLILIVVSLSTISTDQLNQNNKIDQTLNVTQPTTSSATENITNPSVEGSSQGITTKPQEQMLNVTEPTISSATDNKTNPSMEGRSLENTTQPQDQTLNVTQPTTTTTDNLSNHSVEESSQERPTQPADQTLGVTEPTTSSATDNISNPSEGESSLENATQPQEQMPNVTQPTTSSATDNIMNPSVEGSSQENTTQPQDRYIPITDHVRKTTRTVPITIHSTGKILMEDTRPPKGTTLSLIHTTTPSVTDKVTKRLTENTSKPKDTTFSLIHPTTPRTTGKVTILLTGKILKKKPKETKFNLIPPTTPRTTGKITILLTEEIWKKKPKETKFNLIHPTTPRTTGKVTKRSMVKILKKKPKKPKGRSLKGKHTTSSKTHKISKVKRKRTNTFKLENIRGKKHPKQAKKKENIKKKFCKRLWKTFKILPRPSQLRFEKLLSKLIGKEELVVLNNKRKYQKHFTNKRRKLYLTQNHGKSNFGIHGKTPKQQLHDFYHGLKGNRTRSSTTHKISKHKKNKTKKYKIKKIRNKNKRHQNFCKKLWETVKILPPSSQLRFEKLLSEAIGGEELVVLNTWKYQKHFKNKHRRQSLSNNHGKSNFGIHCKTPKQQFNDVCNLLWKKLTENIEEDVKDPEYDEFGKTSKPHNQYGKLNCFNINIEPLYK